GNALNRQSEIGASKTYYEQALPLCREIGERVAEGRTLGNLGIVAFNEGDFAGAGAFSHQALLIFREVGHQLGVCYALNSIGGMALEQGNYDLALTYYRD